MYNVNVGRLELLQARFNAEEHRFCVVAGEVALDRLRVIARVVVRRELLPVSMIQLVNCRPTLVAMTI